MLGDPLEVLKRENRELKYRLAQVVTLSEHFAMVDPLRAAVALHRKTMLLNAEPHQCAECYQHWPCRTRRVADGEAT